MANIAILGSSFSAALYRNKDENEMQWNVHPLIVPQELSIKNLNLNESKELMEIVTKYYNIPDSKQIRRMLEL
jgi:hypothetical protein|tara:strand:+ start:178 stop:396 length:219 start_codon:yes stop_codon:yes gene_type:complete